VVLSVNVCTPPQVTSELSRVVQPRGAGESMKHSYLKIKKINRSESLPRRRLALRYGSIVKLSANLREQGNDP
jgi:hypothetical protein